MVTNGGTPVKLHASVVPFRNGVCEFFNLSPVVLAQCEVNATDPYRQTTKRSC